MIPVDADTITDEQITQIQRRVRNKGAGRDVHRHVRDALRPDEEARYRGARYNARAYCAGVWNRLFGGES